jgi:hypothetical protein
VSDFWQHIPVSLRLQEDSIDRLAAKDNEFRELCGDFDDCVAALRHWEESGAPEAEARAGDYRELLASLQLEIERFLKLEARERSQERENST